MTAKWHSSTTYLWGRLHYVRVDQLSKTLPSTVFTRKCWWLWHRISVHGFEGLIQPANLCKQYHKEIMFNIIIHHIYRRSSHLIKMWNGPTCYSTLGGCCPHRSLVYPQSPTWSSCLCEKHGEVPAALLPFSSAFLAHQVTTTDWIQRQNSPTHHLEPEFS